jgi:hypothetical protein
LFPSVEFLVVFEGCSGVAPHSRLTRNARARSLKARILRTY